MSADGCGTSDVDRYITDEAVRSMRGQYDHDRCLFWPKHILRAVLPGILAQHRADVLREAAREVHERWGTQLPAADLYRMADEAVAE